MRKNYKKLLLTFNSKNVWKDTNYSNIFYTLNQKFLILYVKYAYKELIQ